jgi:TolB-like protein
MKIQIRFVIIAIAMMASAPLLRAATSDVLSVAVFDFDSKDDPEVRKLGPQISSMINATLSTEPELITVERAELQKTLGEQELGLSGTVSADTAAKVGQLTGAKVLVTGRAFKLDQKLVIVAKIISAETSRVYGAMEQGDPANASDLSTKLAKKIAKTITDKADTLVTKVVSREERIQRIVKNLKGGKRPAVGVAIAERHFGARVIDPAAETELLYILQKAGFTVVDAKSDKKPDLELDGEAFSAFGMRHGNLVSCRSRIELKARERATGKILVVDRQTSVAVDISEQNAAKAALENAADELAARLVPILAK